MQLISVEMENQSVTLLQGGNQTANQFTFDTHQLVASLINLILNVFEI